MTRNHKPLDFSGQLALGIVGAVLTVGGGLVCNGGIQSIRYWLAPERPPEGTPYKMDDDPSYIHFKYFDGSDGLIIADLPYDDPNGELKWAIQNRRWSTVDEIIREIIKKEDRERKWNVYRIDEPR